MKKLACFVVGLLIVGLLPLGVFAQETAAPAGPSTIRPAEVKPEVGKGVDEYSIFGMIMGPTTMTTDDGSTTGNGNIMMTWRKTFFTNSLQGGFELLVSGALTDKEEEQMTILGYKMSLVYNIGAENAPRFLPYAGATIGYQTFSHYMPDLTGTGGQTTMDLGSSVGVPGGGQVFPDS